MRAKVLSFLAVAMALAVLAVPVDSRANSKWECTIGMWNYDTRFEAYGVDASFKCLCVVYGISMFRGYYREWYVPDTFAGFGCKGTCIKSSKWKQVAAETQKMLEDYKRENCCIWQGKSWLDQPGEVGVSWCENQDWMWKP